MTNGVSFKYLILSKKFEGINVPTFLSYHRFSVSPQGYEALELLSSQGLVFITESVLNEIVPKLKEGLFL